MQTSKEFKTYNEAKDFAKWHKQSWIHPVYTGIKDAIPLCMQRKLMGYLVIYIVKE